MSFGETLTQIRKERNISQMGLAEQLGVTRQTISRWETGAARPSTEKLILLAQVLQVSLDTLTNGKTEISDAEETPEEKADVQSLKEERASVPQKAESDSPKLPKSGKRAITYGVIALIILIFGIVIGTIWANNHVSVISTKNSGNRHFSGMESDSWEKESAERFSFTW